MHRWLWIAALALALSAGAAEKKTEKKKAPEKVRSIKQPKEPLPREEESANINRFAFIIYGDTRGRRDGKDVQYEHSLIVDSMVDAIKKSKTNGIPIRFVLQSGDAVVDGRDAKQWNNSFVELINRITTSGGVPYFLAPGNHDVTGAGEITSTNRHKGLTNYLAAMAQLIPPPDSVRRLEGYPTFAFGYGNSFFMALDSNIAGDPNQYLWVVSQLESLDRSRYKNLFAFFHHPPFSSGGHGGANIEGPARDLRKLYMPLFRQHEVRAIFSGHEHLFEHWVERWVDKNGVKHRMDQIVTGGGGAPLARYTSEPATGDYIKAGKGAKIELEHLVKPGLRPADNPYHYVVVEVDGTDIRMRVVGIDWGSDFKPYRSNAVTFE